MPSRIGTAPADETPWKHFTKQSVRSGQVFMQSGMTGFAGGQQGMSSAIAAIDMDAAPPPATARAVSGTLTSPRIARTGSKRRRASQNLTGSESHIDPGVERPERSQGCKSDLEAARGNATICHTRTRRDAETSEPGTG